MSEPRTIQIGACTIELWPDFLRTKFDDGLEVPAAANYDDDSVRRAWELGYDGDTWAMSKAHEVAHSLLCCALGYQHSLVLRGVAIRNAGGCKEDYVTPVQSVWEETLVMDFQRWVQTGEVSRTFATAQATYGLDWDALAEQLREITACVK